MTLINNPEKCRWEFTTANKDVATRLYKLGYTPLFGHRDGNRIYTFLVQRNEKGKFERDLKACRQPWRAK